MIGIISLRLYIKFLYITSIYDIIIACSHRLQFRKVGRNKKLNKAILSEENVEKVLYCINGLYLKEKCGFSFDKAWPIRIELLWSGFTAVNNPVGHIPVQCRWEKDAGNSVVYTCVCNTEKQEEPSRLGG